MNQYAINVADLTRFAQKSISPPMLLIQPVMTNRVVNAEPGRFDGSAALLDCSEERALAIVSVIRVKIPRHMLRIYVNSGRRWRRI